MTNVANCAITDPWVPRGASAFGERTLNSVLATAFCRRGLLLGCSPAVAFPSFAREAEKFVLAKCEHQHAESVRSPDFHIRPTCGAQFVAPQAKPPPKTKRP